MSEATADWWTRFRKRLRPPRRAIPTIPGLFALGAPTFLGLAAVTATNNLLFLVLGATLGAVVLSGILSERAVRPLEVDVRPAGPIYAGELSSLEVRFWRREAQKPLFDLSFKETGGAFFWQKPKPHVQLVVQLPIMEHLEARVLGRRRFEERGRAKLKLCEITTRYPFGLLTKAKDVEPSIEVWVRPRIVERPPSLVLPPGVVGEGQISSVKGQGVEVFGLREKREFDSAHRVHALRSAALGKEVVMEMTADHRPTAVLGIANGRGADRVAFERTLEVAQAALRKWEEDGFAVGLWTLNEIIRPGEESLEVVLDTLAVMQLVAADRTLTKGAPLSWLVPSGVRGPSGCTPIRVGAGGLS